MNEVVVVVVKIQKRRSGNMQMKHQVFFANPPQFIHSNYIRKAHSTITQYIIHDTF